MKYSNDYTTNNSQEQITGKPNSFYVAFPTSVYDLKLSPAEFMIFTFFFGFANADEIFFTQSYISDHLGLSRKTINKGIGSLAKKGLLAKNKQSKYSTLVYKISSKYIASTFQTDNTEKSYPQSYPQGVSKKVTGGVTNLHTNNKSNNNIIKKENNIKEKKKWKSVECLDTIEFVQALKSKFSDNVYLEGDISGMRRWLRDERNLSKHPRNYLLFAYNWIKKANQFRADRLYRQRMRANVDEHQRMVLEENKAGNRPAFQLKSFGISPPSYLN